MRDTARGSRGIMSSRGDRGKSFGARGGSMGGRGSKLFKGSMRGGRGRGGMGGGNKTIITPHRFQGIFIAKGGKGDSLVTRNLVPGISVYGEKLVEVTEGDQKIEYRVWNPFRSKLGATIVGGAAHMPINPGSKVLYLGAASGTTVSHVSDIVGPDGIVYAVEFAPRVGRDLTNMAARRPNIVPIIEDARQPLKYRMLIDSVDVIFSDVAQPDQERIVALNASYFLRDNGWAMLSIKAACVDSAVAPEAVYAAEVDRLRQDNFKPKEQLTLEPYHRDHALVTAIFRPSKKAK